MKAAAAFLLIIAILCGAGQTVQTDWCNGTGISGPVVSWDSYFESSESTSWLSIPGQLALSSDSLADPVYHLVDFSYAGAYTVDADDLNGDGFIDVICGGNQSPEFTAWLSDGAGGWDEHCISTEAAGPIGSDIADIDGDGNMDILCTTYTGGRVLLFLSSGGSSPVWTLTVISSDFAGGHDVEAFDMDLDGDLDILGAAAEGDKITWWRNDGGSPISWHEQDISTSVDYPCRIQSIDIDGDGCMDVAASMWLDDKVTVWYGSGGGTPSWTEQLVHYPVLGAHSVRACDIDDDGDPDLVASSLDEGRLLLFRNGGGSPAVWNREVVASQTACGYARTGDMDGDGDFDIISCSFGPGGTFWYENSAAGTSWQKHVIVSGLGSTACSLPADLDGDGDLDALLALMSQNKVMWYEFSEFRASGSLVSSILDTGCTPQWASIDWDVSLPGAASFSVSYRSSSDAGSMGSWSTPLQYPTELSGLLERYFQYRIDMATSDPSVSPILRSLELNWDPTGISGPESDAGTWMSLETANPVAGPVLLHLFSTHAALPQVSVFDCSGRRVWSATVSVSEGSGRLLQVPGLPAGSYRVLLHGEAIEQQVLPVVIID